METEKRLIDANLLKRYAYADPETGEGTVYVQDIDNAPTVDAVEVVHGRWIDRPTMKGQVYCSECATLEKATDSNYRSRNCPNCGARMDGDGNG